VTTLQTFGLSAIPAFDNHLFFWMIPITDGIEGETIYFGEASHSARVWSK